jgi:hypothetical protein
MEHAAPLAQQRAISRAVIRYAGGKPIPAPMAILINLMVGGVVTPDEVDAVRRQHGRSRRARSSRRQPR